MSQIEHRKAPVQARRHLPSKDDIKAEHEDPYALGWDAGADLDNPPPCPYKDGLCAQLWRNGFSARVDKFIADVRRMGGINASLT
jgi:hypothetical protein